MLVLFLLGLLGQFIFFVAYATFLLVWLPIKYALIVLCATLEWLVKRFDPAAYAAYRGTSS